MCAVRAVSRLLAQDGSRSGPFSICKGTPFVVHTKSVFENECVAFSDYI